MQGISATTGHKLELILTSCHKIKVWKYSSKKKTNSSCLTYISISTDPSEVTNNKHQYLKMFSTSHSTTKLLQRLFYGIHTMLKLLPFASFQHISMALLCVLFNYIILKIQLILRNWNGIHTAWFIYFWQAQRHLTECTLTHQCFLGITYFQRNVSNTLLLPFLLLEKLNSLS